MSETATCHVATLNLPSQVKGKKSNLAPHPQRTEKAIQKWEAHNVTVCALQELATTSRNTILNAPTWQGVWSTNDTRDNGVEIGNGVAYRGDLWHLVDSCRLDVPMAGRDTPLKQLVALLQRRDGTKAQLAVMAVHHPTRTDDPQDVARKECRRVENAYAAKLEQAGLSVVLAGDFNDGAALETMGSDLWKAGAHKQVDWVMGYRDTGLKWPDEGGKVDTSVHGTVTDHPGMPHVKATFPIRPPLTKLPAK